jgi:hypothetical protein
MEKDVKSCSLISLHCKLPAVILSQPVRELFGSNLPQPVAKRFYGSQFSKIYETKNVARGTRLIARPVCGFSFQLETI